MTILDTSPIDTTSDAAILSLLIDSTLMVVKANYTNIDDLHQKIQEYPNIQKNLIGLVLNQIKLDTK
ncbi:MAG: hypothetical protein GWN01_17780, partial [Nitrosopumilaceae archaeon]|nr:CpsD/CapB family tyrosine-protein kinase [Nitrosopumilaceae archaeon]NIX63273.1 hypothetical protein [Nitrosopumilaceae archaeon]